MFYTFIEYLQDLLKSGKSTFSFYTHNSQKNWATVLSGDTKANARKDMDALCAYFTTHQGMAGLIIQDLRYEVFIHFLKIFFNVFCRICRLLVNYDLQT